MFDVVRTTDFDTWLVKLNDLRGKQRILRRLDRLAQGNPGDMRPVGKGLSELRIDTGPGYRVYYRQEGHMLILLLCGGDKSTQQQDIRKARQLASKWVADTDKERP